MSDKPSKYFAKAVVEDGIRFSSKKESRVYLVLKREAEQGTIRDLVLQPRYPITINGQKVCTYIADFKYRDVATGQYRVIDVKGMDTPLSKLKRKMVKALYDIDVEIV